MSTAQPEKQPRWYHKPILTTLLYLVFGMLWITFTTVGFRFFTQDAEQILFYTTLTRWIFLSITALYISYLLYLNHRRVQLLSRYDRMTSLPNRTFFTEQLNRYIELGRARSETFALVYIDIYRFNQVNDSFGHEVGDRIILQMVDRLKGLMPRDGLLARFTGVEFVMLLPHMSRAEAEQMARQVLHTVTQQPYWVDEHEHYLTLSVGLTGFPSDGMDAALLLRNADLAMNRAKEKGKNEYQFYHAETGRSLNRRLVLENGLRSALRNGEFSLRYQPKLEIHSGRLIGMEALLRWHHPMLGWVSPAEFIPIAEETGMIVPIGEWVLHTACAQNKRWQEEGLPRLRVAVNLSIRQFETHSLLEVVQRILAETGLDPCGLELEITEGIAIIQADYVVNTLNRLKELGIKIAIDDFGTGYSSLSYLKHFSIDSLKIDQSFIRDLDPERDDNAIVKAISTMAHSLRLNIVAEGVEKPEQMLFLQGIGCHEAQGYWISHPLSADEFRAFLEGKKEVS